MGNITLILGTVLSQLAIGTFITGYVLDRQLGRVEEKPALQTTLAAFAVGVVGLLVMILHLGHPLLAFNALFNLGSSWLSREVVFYGGFLALTFVYLLIQKGLILKTKQSALKGLGLAASVAGVMAAFVTSMIYTIPSIPAWNSANTPISFLLSAALMGLPLGMFLSGAYKTCGAPGAKAVSAVSVFALVAAAIFVSTLTASLPASGMSAAATSASLLLGSALFWVRMVLLALSGGLAGYVGAKGAAANAANLFLCLFGMLAVSELLGRILFYGTIVRL